MTLSEFLLQRIAEDEAMARRLPSVPPAAVVVGELPIVGMTPARVLAECEARRRIVELHTGSHECVGDRHGQTGTVLVAEGYIHENDPTLRLLALPYVDRPDFQQEWKV